MSFRLRSLLAILLTTLATTAAHTQATAPVLQLGNVNVGSSTTGTVTFTFTGSTTVASIAVVTQGTTGLDYTLSSSPGTCTVGTIYELGDTCTVGVTFTPQAAGPRLGGVQLLDSSGNFLATANITGTGTGAQLTYANTALTTLSLAGYTTDPAAVAVDAAGNLYIADAGSARILKITPTSAVTICSCGLTTPSALAIDGDGYIYVSDLNANTVTRVNMSLSTPTYATLNSLYSVTFSTPEGLVFDSSGNLYVSEAASSAYDIVKVTSTGTKSTFATLSSSTYAIQMVFDATGNMYYAAYPAGAVYKIASGGSSASSYSTVTNAYGIAIDPAGNLWVQTTTSTSRLYEIPAGSTSATAIITSGFSNGHRIAMDAAGDIFIPDYSTDNVYEVIRGTDALTVSGLTPVGSDSTQQTATFTNTGNASASFSAVAVTGAAISGSSTTCSTSTPVATAGTCVLGIEFAPTTHGASPQTGALTLAGNLPSAGVTISGNVTGDPTKLVFTSAPPSTVAAGGNAGTVTVTLEDSTGATAVNATTLPVTLTVKYPNNSTVTYGPTNAVAGVVTFSTAANTLTLSGSYTYTATSSGLTNASASETVSPGTATHLGITPASTSTYTGVSDNMTVNALDQYGNVATTDTDTITLSSTDTAATLPSSFALASGTATKAVTFNTAGSQTVTATDTTNGSVTSGVSSFITVTALPMPTYTVTTPTDDNSSPSASNCPIGVTTGTTCSLRDALAAVTALGITGTTSTVPTITFSSSLYGQTINMGAGVTVSGNVALVGPGAGTNAITLSGQSSYAFLTQNGAGVVTNFTGLTFTSFSNTSGGGGGVLDATSSTAGSITITNDVFTSNHSGGDAGGLYIANAAVTVTNSTFSSNTSNGGSAIFVLTGSLNASNSYFYSNSSIANGGAIYNASGSTLTLTNDTFSANYAKTDGGAIFDVGPYTITNTWFNGNYINGTSSPVYGGAMYSNNTTSTNSISNCSFTANYVTTSSASGVANGGALYFEGGTILNSLFSGNKVVNNYSASGGAVYALTGTITITGTTFTGNSVTTSSGSGTNYHYAGALYNNTATMKLYNDTITQNSATSFSGTGTTYPKGGGVYSGSAATAYNTVISGNTALATYEDEYNVTVGTGLGNYIDSSATTTCFITYCSPMLAPLPASSTGSGNGLTIGATGYTTTLQVMLPLPGSPLLAAGAFGTSNAYLNSDATDGRGTGFPRTVNYAGNNYVDIGAAEANYTLAFASQPTNSTTTANISGSPSIQIYESGIPFTYSSTNGNGSIYVADSFGGHANYAITTATTGLEAISAEITTPETDDTLLATLTNSTTLNSGTTLANATSDYFNVTPASGNEITFVTPPTPLIASGGNAGTVQVGCYTSTGTPDSIGTNVTININGAGGYTNSATGTTNSQGVATISLTSYTLTTAGNYNYIATCTGLSGNAIATETLSSDPVDHFVVTGSQHVASGAATTYTVTAYDASNAVLTSFAGNLVLSATDSSATFVPPNYTYNASDAGVHTFAVTFTTAGLQSLTATTDSGQTGTLSNIQVGTLAWILNKTGALSEINGSGTTVVSPVGISGTTSTAGGLAIDSTGNLWSVTSANNTLNYITYSGTNPATHSGGGLNAPASLAIDGNNYIWIANNGNASVSVFNNSGTAQTGTSGYGISGTTAIGANPTSIAIDNSGGVWITSKTANTVTHLVGAATPITTPLSTATTNNTLGTKP